MNRIKREVKSKLVTSCYAVNRYSITSVSKTAIVARGQSENLGCAAVSIKTVPLSNDDKMVRALNSSRHERLKLIGRDFRYAAATLSAIRSGTVKHPYLRTSFIRTARRLNVPVSLDEPEKTLRNMLKHYLREFRFIAANYATGPRCLPA